MDSKITVVVVTRENNKDELLQHIKDTCGFGVHVMYLVNTDGISLTRIYSDMLERIDTDVVVFMHDDIEYLKNGWGLEIVRLFERNKDYGIIGVAGSAEYDERGAWWNYPKKFGQVLHRHEGKSWLTAFSPLINGDLEEVCVIDGLFMAVNKKRISKTFDVDFEGFNHYDTSFCLSNYVDGKCKIGVTTKIRIAHSSIGETKQNWYDNLDLLNDKFEEYYPIDVKSDKRKRSKSGVLNKKN